MLTALVASGCSGESMGEVVGTVSVDGKLAEKGAIAFIPADGKSRTAGATIKDGKYEAMVPVGTAKVQIRVPKVVGKKKLYDAPDSEYAPILEEVLPPRYNEQTELTLEVQPGKNEKAFDLQSK